MTMNRFTTGKNQKGFTLIELVTVIILLGVMSVGIASFFSIATQTYVNASERDELIASARFSVERLNREIREALPNSARVLSFANNIDCIEFVPIVASSTYLSLATLQASDKIDVIRFLGSPYNTNNDYNCTNTCGDHVSVYPLYNNDVYVNPNQSNGQLFAIKNVDKTGPDSDLWQINLTNNVTFNTLSPTDRLYIINQPQRYCEDNGNLMHVSRYNLSDQLANSAYPANSISTLMAENVDVTFNVAAATLTRNSVVQVSMVFTRGSDVDERIVFNHEIHISNTP